MTSPHPIEDLKTLIASAAPRHEPGEYVFVTLSDATAIERLQPIGTFREAEGWSVLCARAHAEASGLPFSGCFGWIVLEVHSSLHAVGFLAAITSRLALEKIPCNAVSAYHHDHLFVPIERVEEAMETLRAWIREESPAPRL